MAVQTDSCLIVRQLGVRYSYAFHIALFETRICVWSSSSWTDNSHVISGGVEARLGCHGISQHDIYVSLSLILFRSAMEVYSRCRELFVCHLNKLLRFNTVKVDYIIGFWVFTKLVQEAV